MEALLPAAATILVAGTPEAVVTAKYALGTAFNYVPAYTIDQAASFLCAPVDVIVCNVAFDSSRMFDFIRAARQGPKSRTIPIVCFRQRPLSRTTHEAIENALGAFGLTTFVGLFALTAQAGVTHALLAFRAAVLAALRLETPVMPLSQARKEASGL